jgi:hypothetical protein
LDPIYTEQDNTFIRQYFKETGTPYAFIKDVYTTFKVNREIDIPFGEHRKGIVHRGEDLDPPICWDLDQAVVNQITTKNPLFYDSMHDRAFIKVKQLMDFAIPDIDPNLGRPYSPTKTPERITDPEIDFVLIYDGIVNGSIKPVFYKLDLILEVLQIIYVHFTPLDGWTKTAHLRFKIGGDTPLYIFVADTKGNEYLFIILPHFFEIHKSISLDLPELLGMSLNEVEAYLVQRREEARRKRQKQLMVNIEEFLLRINYLEFVKVSAIYTEFKHENISTINTCLDILVAQEMIYREQSGGDINVKFVQARSLLAIEEFIQKNSYRWLESSKIYAQFPNKKEHIIDACLDILVFGGKVRRERTLVRWERAAMEGEWLREREDESTRIMNIEREEAAKREKARLEHMEDSKISK